MSTRPIDEVVDRLESLPIEAQEQVLQLVRTLDASQMKGVPGKQLIRFAGTMDASNLESMTRAIEDGCGQVKP